MSTFETYQKFLRALYAPSDVVAFAFINHKGGVEHAFLPRIEAETEKYFDTLTKLNQVYSIFAGMNPFKSELVGEKKGRTKENVAEVKRLYADADYIGLEGVQQMIASGKVPAPTVMLESSPTKFQLIWNVAGLTQDTAEPLLKAIASEFKTDAAVCEISRVLRVPGFRNMKYEERPQVKLVSIDPEANYNKSVFHFEVGTRIEPKGEAARNAAGLIPHGSLHPWILSQAGKLRAAGMNESEILPVLLRLVHEKCQPPIDENRVKAVAKSVCVYPPTDGSIVLNQQLTPVVVAAPTEITTELLMKEFPAYDGTEPNGLPMLIEGFMPEGVGFFGSLSGTGKTWVGLSVAKALTSGAPLLGVFAVKEKAAVLYLIPEASDASFKRRLKKMGITQDKSLFRFRTITQGRTRFLTDELTLAMIKELASTGRKVLVIVDTAVRFLRAGDENSAMENSLVRDSDLLRSMGANVLFQHHSPKATKDAPELTLENVLRGTGDFGAMSDYVYGFRRDEAQYNYGEGPEEVEVVCVKPRDFDPPLPFRLRLKRKAKHGEDGPTVSVIDEAGDLKYIGNTTLKEGQAKMLVATFKEDPYISFNMLTGLLKMKRELIKDFCKAHGWKQVAEMVTNAKRVPVRRFRWTNQLLMAGQADEIDRAVSFSEADQPENTVQLEDMSAGF
jgi:hypothetical protein